jgi:protein-S-isoprenylcysteine O-methyltransferase Ste14
VILTLGLIIFVMRSLELKIPPVALALLIALAMWGGSLVTPSLALPFLARIVIAFVFVSVGASISIAGVVSFQRAKTTVNPTKPNSSSTLVCSGIYSVTRNPMYLGIFLILTGWAAFLSNAFSLLGAFAFVVYMNRFQIVPEEKALSAIFGTEFTLYKAKVPRWL